MSVAGGRGIWPPEVRRVALMAGRVMTSWQAFLLGFASTSVPSMGFYLLLRERPKRMSGPSDDGDAALVEWARARYAVPGRTP